MDATALSPLAAGRGRERSDEALPPADHDHTTGVSTSSLVLEHPVAPAVVSVWLSALLHAHGDRLLRVKALLDTGAGGPLVLDAVQHSVYRPHHLEGFDGPRRSTLVVIARDLDAARVTASFARAAGRPA